MREVRARHGFGNHQIGVIVEAWGLYEVSEGKPIGHRKD